jgi:hypothetical protein
VHLLLPYEEEWKKISDNIQSYANFPSCVVAVDGKHIHIMKPLNSDSLFHNSKQLFSMVLLAFADLNYRFIFVESGSDGKSSDSSTLKASALSKKNLGKDSEHFSRKSIGRHLRPVSSLCVRGRGSIWVIDEPLTAIRRKKFV